MHVQGSKEFWNRLALWVSKFQVLLSLTWIILWSEEECEQSMFWFLIHTCFQLTVLLFLCSVKNFGTTSKFSCPTSCTLFFFSCFHLYSSFCIYYIGNGWFGSNNWGVLGSRCRGKVDGTVCCRASCSVPLTFKLWIWTFSYCDNCSKQHQHHSILKRVNNINTSEYCNPKLV